MDWKRWTLVSLSSYCLLSTALTLALLSVEKLVVDRPFLPRHALPMTRCSSETQYSHVVLWLLGCAFASIIAVVPVVGLLHRDRPASIAMAYLSSAIQALLI